MRDSDRSLISEVYEAAVIPEKWSQVLERISDTTGATGGFMIAETTDIKSWIATERFRPIVGSFFSQDWHVRNPWAERSRRRKRVYFFDETDIFAPGETDTIPMYRDFIRPLGGGWSAGTLMEIPTGDRVAIRFERPFRDGPMNPALRKRLNLLRPHLAHASFLFARLRMRQARSAVSALQFMDVPAAVLTNTGRLLACNAAMETRLSQVSIRAGDRIAFTDCTAQTSLSESLARITAGLFDQMRGPIAIPATEEHGAAIAYLIPQHGAAQDVFGYSTTLLMIRPAHPEDRLLDLVRAQFAIDAGEAHRVEKLVSSVHPRSAAALIASMERFRMGLDRHLGTARTQLEAQVASFLWRLGKDAKPLPTMNYRPDARARCS